MKYIVFGNTTLLISVEVEANSEAEAMKKAKKQFKGVHAYFGNGGSDKLIGVEGDKESVWVDDPVTFDDCMPN